MRPPPHPSSSSSHYSSFSEASQPGTSSQLPSLRAGLPPEAYSPTGRVHGEQRSDQHFQRFSTQSTSTRSTHPPSPSQSDATAYAHNRHSASMSSNEGTQQLSELRTGPSAPPPMLTGLPHHSTESRYVFLWLSSRHPIQSTSYRERVSCMRFASRVPLSR